ncbi:MAG: rod shape-determining protein RodA [Deltaproteobacteria bacterium]|nr:rod shape-determining protein RodA [Deltaproteobacteria bacterium]
MWRHAPWPLLMVAAGIAALGVWNLISASRAAHSPLWKAQAYWLGVGLAVCLTIMLVDYRYLLRLAYPIYGVVLVLLIAVKLKGHAAMGAQRWLDLGPMHLQPSELMKIAVILVLARFYHDDPRHKEGYSLFDLWLPWLLVIPPVVLVLKQPDLGTASMIAVVSGSLILFGKLRAWTLVVFAVLGLIGAVLGWGYYSHCNPGIPKAQRPKYCVLLKDYQLKRVSSFLDPEADTLGSGYHASQSLIAVGSGQGWGKGWGEGSQTRLSFLPEQHTDFIFSVWAEERGFFGAVVLVLLYLLMLLLAVGVAVNAREKFGSFIAVGVTAMLFWQVFINIGMVTGMFPVVGVTLPLMSYGGSSVLTVMVGMGLLMNVGMRKYLF